LLKSRCNRLNPGSGWLLRGITTAPLEEAAKCELPYARISQ